MARAGRESSAGGVVAAHSETLKRRRRLPACAIGLAAALAAGEAVAGGMFLYEVGTSDMATASAGWAARAQDASTVMTNPAGMTRLEGNELLAGVQLLYGGMGFSTNADTTVAGGNGGEPIGWVPGGSLFYVHGLKPRLRFGFGLYGNFGLALDYDDDWAGRYYVQDTTLMGISVSPALAYKVNERWSVGAALVAMYGVFDYQAAVNNLLNLLPDGKLETDDSDWGYGANLGVLFEPSAASRFGLTYTSKIDLDFSDRPKFSNLGPVLNALVGGLQELDLGMTVPQTLTASVYHELNGRWALLGNVRWEDWSQFGKVDVQVSAATTTDVTVDADYKDTWQLALGAQYRVSDDWRLGFGAAYDSSPVDDDQRSPAFPVADTWRLGVGGQYLARRDMEIGLAYTVALPADMPVDQQRGPLAGRLAGEYDDTPIHFFAANFRWRY